MATERKTMLDDLTNKAATLEALLDLLNQRGFFPKQTRPKARVVEKIKFIVRRPRTQKVVETGAWVPEGASESTPAS